LALEPKLALNLVDACAKGHAEARDIKKVPKKVQTLFPVSGVRRWPEAWRHWPDYNLWDGWPPLICPQRCDGQQPI